MSSLILDVIQIGDPILHRIFSGGLSFGFGCLLLETLLDFVLAGCRFFLFLFASHYLLDVGPFVRMIYFDRGFSRPLIFFRVVTWSGYDFMSLGFVIQKVAAFGDVLAVLLALLLFEILSLLDGADGVEVFAVDVVALNAAGVSAGLEVVDMLYAQLLHGCQ